MEQALDDAQISKVHDPIVIEIRIAEVADVVTIGVALIRVGNVQTIIQNGFNLL